MPSTGSERRALSLGGELAEWRALLGPPRDGARDVRRGAVSRGRVAGETERNRLDRPDVRRDVLTLESVAARRAAHEHAVLIGQIDRETVDLRLEDIGDRLSRAEALAYVVVPLSQRFVRRHLLERAHWLEVLDLREPVRQPAHPQGRRIGSDELLVLRLDRDELVEERVVRRVLHDRRVVDVVRNERAPEDLAQLCGAGRVRTHFGKTTR